MKILKHDIAIIGSGIAGQSFALKMASKRPDLSIAIFSKDKLNQCNSNYAQGGMAVVTDERYDSIERHVQDTLAAGGGLCDESIVRMVVSKAPARLQELIRWGVAFDQNENGLDLALEGGHRAKRIVHVGDSTGAAFIDCLHSRLYKLENVSIYEHHFATQLLVHQDEALPKSIRQRLKERTCAGVKLIESIRGKSLFVNAKITVLATGGAGQLFAQTTNPAMATADGIAMANRVGAGCKDLHYVQFHPTAFYNEKGGESFLLSEALRGAGAFIVNHDGKRFLFDHDPRGELATRDVISNAIKKELTRSGQKHVYLFCGHLDADMLKAKFPKILQMCLEHGFDIRKKAIPVAPAAHYLCGGILTDKHARSDIKQLYAIGECAYTGLHGANRLASNSLLEGLVFAHEAMLSCLMEVDNIQFLSLQKWIKSDIKLTEFNENCDELHQIRKELRCLMTNSLYGETNQHKLLIVKHRLDEIHEKAVYLLGKSGHSTARWELLNMVEVGKLMLSEKIEVIDVSRRIQQLGRQKS